MSPNNGTLGAGNSTSTNVVIGASANSLSPGLHEAEIVFSILGSGQSITREVRLSAIASPQTIQFFDLNSNPGWTTAGAWAYGVPQGLGSFGGDPASGKTGTKVYGYNLSGDYTNNLGDTNLTTGAVDCRGYVGGLPYFLAVAGHRIRERGWCAPPGEQRRRDMVSTLEKRCRWFQ